MKTAFEILTKHHDTINHNGEKPSEYEEDRILMAMEEYAAQFKPNEQQGGVVRPEMEGAKVGELLPAEGLAKSVCGGVVIECEKCGEKIQWPVTSTVCEKCG